MIKDKNIKDRYIKLIEIINKHNLLYHTYDSPKITDDEFDDLYRELKQIEKKFPSIENFIELIPRQTPPKVSMLGKRYLVFFEDTNLNFLFCSIIPKL